VVEQGTLRPEPVATLPASQATAEGGLMGLALAPDFAASGALYVYYTYDAAGEVRNRVSRLRLGAGGPPEETIVLDDIPGAHVHGLAWQPGTGQLYAAKHGPTGENGWCCHDEINRIVPGGNYGWPEVIGQAGDPRFLDPVVESGSGSWPPGGLAFAEGGAWAG